MTRSKVKFVNLCSRVQLDEHARLVKDHRAFTVLENILNLKICLVSWCYRTSFFTNLDHNDTTSGGG